MIRKFNVTVDGKTYLVEMEELGSPVANTQAAPQPQPQAQPSATTAQPQGHANEGDTILKAPMPGNILDIKVAVGDRVTTDQVLCVLEAMKMENEIVSPCNGVVTAVHVQKGSPIDVGKPMVAIRPE